MTSKHATLSRYGGRSDVQLPATGYFRVQGGGDRWTLVDPDGHPFFVVGINHFDDNSLKLEDNIHVWHDRYGSSRATWIRKGVVEPLRAWGFNTLSWSKEWVSPGFRHSPEWTPEEYRASGLAYIPHLDFSPMECWNHQSSFPDVFDRSFEDWCDYVARYWCQPLADDPHLLGYAYHARPMMVDHPFTESWVQKYDIDMATDAGRARFREVVHRYYRTTHAAIRRYDKNHLILGDLIDGRPNKTIDELEQTTPVEVFEEMRPFVDVLCINWYSRFETIEPAMKRWQQITGKPVYLSDSGFFAVTPWRKEHPPSQHADSQAHRGELYCDFIRKAAATGYCIGWGWCSYIENRVRGHGLRTHLDEPYTDCTDIMARFNADLYDNLALR